MHLSLWRSRSETRVLNAPLCSAGLAPKDAYGCVTPFTAAASPFFSFAIVLAGSAVCEVRRIIALVDQRDLDRIRRYFDQLAHCVDIAEAPRP